MKHLLRKYEALASEHEAEVPDLYEAKHAQILPCGEATLHGGSRFIVHAPAARFICSSALRDKNKTHLGKVGFEIVPRHNVFITKITSIFNTYSDRQIGIY